VGALLKEHHKGAYPGDLFTVVTYNCNLLS
jgi:hypothetical protein